jgi:predicted porin
MAVLAIAGPVFGAGLPASAQEERPHIGVGGFMRQIAGFASNDRLSAGGRTDFDIQVDSEIHFRFKTRLDNGLIVDGRWELEGATASDQIDEAFMRITGRFGQLVVGSENSAAYQMQIGPKAVSTSMTSADRWVVNTTGAATSGNSGIEDVRLKFEDGDSEKITYYTPRMAGLQLGLSYVPDADEDNNAELASSGPLYANGVALGVNFHHRLDGVEFGLAAGTATWADPTQGRTTRPIGYSLGFRLGHGGFVAAASYMSIDDLFGDGGADGEQRNDGAAIRLGLAWKDGPNAASLIYHHGSSEDAVAVAGEDRSDIVSFAVARRLAPGVELGATLFVADWRGEAPGATDDNDGWAVVTEIRLAY